MSFFSPADLLLHFQEYIPRVSDRFSDNADVSAEIIDGTPQILRVTDSSHGLSVGSKVVFSKGSTDTTISSAELFVDSLSSVVRFTTELSHDITYEYTVEVELSGFTDSQFNGVFAIETVPDSTSFELAFDEAPVLNGSEVLRESLEIGTEGLFEISSVIDVDTYEVELTDVKTLQIQTVPILKRASNFRMSVSADLSRAVDYYQAESTKEDLYLFIIMGDSTASKDRNISSDAVAANTSQNPAQILMVSTFTVMVFFPTANDIAGANASDDSWNSILKVMLGAGSGIKFDDFGNSNYLTTLIHHATSLYHKAFYTHGYVFEYNYEVTAEQGFLVQFIESTAFRSNIIALGEIEATEDLDSDS